MAQDMNITSALGDDFMPGRVEQTMHWQIIWIRAIAMAWSDPKFKEALIKDARSALKKHLNYDLSDALDLSIVEAPATAKFDRKKAIISPKKKPQDPWSGLPQIKLELALPPKPDAGEQAVALSSYADTGRTYPFTSC